MTIIIKLAALIILPIFFLFYSFNSSKHLDQIDNGILFTIPGAKIKVDSFPIWVKNLYEINNDEFLNDAIPEIIFFKRISDSISYCLYEVSDGVCLITFVATQKNKKHYKKLKVGNQCDADFSQPSYSYTEYEHNSLTRSIKMTTYIEKAKAKYLIKDGNFERFKKGYNFESAETIHYSMIKKIKISSGGNIIVQK